MALFSNNDQQHKGGLRQAFESAKPSLNLTTEQEQQIKEIFKNLREERQDIQKSGNDNTTDEMRNARQETRQQLMSVLNDDQRKLLQQHLKELRNS